jgi:hypothetical protein
MEFQQVHGDLRSAFPYTEPFVVGEIVNIYH